MTLPNTARPSRADRSRSSQRRGLREPVNGITHMVGVGLALAVTVLLPILASGGGLTVFALLVFGVSSLVLFSASSLLHSVRASPRTETWLRRFDHGAIFVLIAGSYTPVLLIAMLPGYPRLAWWLFGVVWLFALAGVAFKIAWIGAPRWLSTGLYLAMGWLVVLAIVPVARSLGLTNMLWLAAGGFFYSVGAVIYGSKRPDPVPGVFGYHEIWHLFVLAGWACHATLVFRLALLG
ncbi:MAG TPA: hemolysin III family protein [Trueperaceae bacterium]|nr:hemolysin III family protein [Trueperaceae bacterium]